MVHLSKETLQFSGIGGVSCYTVMKQEAVMPW